MIAQSAKTMMEDDARKRSLSNLKQNQADPINFTGRQKGDARDQTAKAFGISGPMVDAASVVTKDGTPEPYPKQGNAWKNASEWPGKDLFLRGVDMAIGLIIFLALLIAPQVAQSQTVKLYSHHAACEHISDLEIILNAIEHNDKKAIDTMIRYEGCHMVKQDGAVYLIEDYGQIVKFRYHGSTTPWYTPRNAIAK